MSIRHIADTHGPEAADRVLTEAWRQSHDLGILPYFHRAVAAHSIDTIKKTHIVVGDHAPEPRRNNEPCDCGDGSTVAQCKGAACKSHNRCCWQ